MGSRVGIFTYTSIPKIDYFYHFNLIFLVFTKNLCKISFMNKWNKTSLWK